MTLKQLRKEFKKRSKLKNFDQFVSLFWTQFSGLGGETDIKL